MFRARRGLAGRGFPRKLAGVALAVAGIAIIIDKVPVVFWWFILGVCLAAAGWKLYTS